MKRHSVNTRLYAKTVLLPMQISFHLIVCRDLRLAVKEEFRHLLGGVPQAARVGKYDVAYTTLSSNHECVIFFREDSVYRTVVAHEIYHATLAIAQRDGWNTMGVPWGREEASAYLNGWLALWCHKHLTDARIQLLEHDDEKRFLPFYRKYIEPELKSIPKSHRLPK